MDGYEMPRLPYEINADSEYEKAYEMCLNKYKRWVNILFRENTGFISQIESADKEKILRHITIDGSVIKSCVRLYYGGNITAASKKMYRLLKRIINEDEVEFIKSSLDTNYCSRLVANYSFLLNSKEEILREAAPLLEHELTFFRARRAYYTDYKEMYHIPLDKRQLVGTERFSIPGIPCLYLGTSVYDVWMELGRPAYSEFNVSAIKLKEQGKKLQILNLTANPYLLLGLVTKISNVDDDRKRKILSLINVVIRAYPLVIATSIRNTNPTGKFRSDYIISHLIMMNLKELSIDGVAYLSKRIENGEEDYAVPQLVNIALPAFDSSLVNRKYGSICDKIEITRASNYEEFLSLELGEDQKVEKESFFAKTFVGNGPIYPDNGIRVSGRLVDYHNTGFYRFENHICSHRFYALS